MNNLLVIWIQSTSAFVLWFSPKLSYHLLHIYNCICGFRVVPQNSLHLPASLNKCLNCICTQLSFTWKILLIKENFSIKNGLLENKGEMTTSHAPPSWRILDTTYSTSGSTGPIHTQDLLWVGSWGGRALQEIQVVVHTSCHLGHSTQQPLQ